MTIVFTSLGQYDSIECVSQAEDLTSPYLTRPGKECEKNVTLK